MKTRRSFPKILILLFLAVIALSALGNPIVASAGDACYNSPSQPNCDGDSPSTSGCSADAYTVQTATITDPTIGPIGYVDLRYSPHCKSNWGRLRSLITSSQQITYHIQVTRPSTGTTMPYQVTTSQGSVVIFDAMVYAPTVCAYAYGWIGGTAESAQTGCF